MGFSPKQPYQLSPIFGYMVNFSIREDAREIIILLACFQRLFTQSHIVMIQLRTVTFPPRTARIERPKCIVSMVSGRFTLNEYACLFRVEFVANMVLPVAMILRDGFQNQAVKMTVPLC